MVNITSTVTSQNPYAKEPDEVESFADYLIIGCVFGMVVFLTLCIYKKLCSSNDHELRQEKSLRVAEHEPIDHEEWGGMKVDWNQSFLDSPPAYDGTNFQSVLKVLENHCADTKLYKRDPVAGERLLSRQDEKKIMIDFVPDRIEPWGTEIVYASGDLPWVVLNVDDGGLFQKKMVKKGWHIIRVNKVQVNKKSKPALQELLETGKSACTIQFEIVEYEKSFRLLNFHGLIPKSSTDATKFVPTSTIEMETIATKIKSQKKRISVHLSEPSFVSDTDGSSTLYHFENTPAAFLDPGEYILTSKANVKDEDVLMLIPLKAGTHVVVDEINASTSSLHITSPLRGWMNLKNNSGVSVLGRRVSQFDKSTLSENPWLADVGTPSSSMPADTPPPPMNTPPSGVRILPTQSTDDTLFISSAKPNGLPPVPRNVNTDNSEDFAEDPLSYLPTVDISSDPAMIREGSFVRTDSGSIKEVVMIADDEGNLVAELRSQKGSLNRSFRNLKSLRNIDEPTE